MQHLSTGDAVHCFVYYVVSFMTTTYKTLLLLVQLLTMNGNVTIWGWSQEGVID